MMLSDRENSILFLDKRSCYIGSVFSSVNDWREPRHALKSYCAKNYAQCESHKRELLIVSQQQEENHTDTENNEERVYLSTEMMTMHSHL